jgi:transglutaminase/protease-like cytokinesis protein 3
MVIFIFPLIGLGQSKKEIISMQKQKIDSLNEALEIEKSKFNSNNEQLRIINEDVRNWHDQYVNSYHKIDFHIIKCPNSIKKDAEMLIDYFNEVATTEIEKTRAIYVWIANNIKYDDLAYNSDSYLDSSPEAVLASKKAVCAGYAELFTFFCQKMNLEVKTISGYAKGYSYRKGNSFENKSSNHAWNIVKIDGLWRVFDATWGAGYGVNRNGKLVSIEHFNDDWFNASPYETIFSHYPDEEEYLLINEGITLKQFESLPNIEICAFKTGLLDVKETLLKHLNSDIILPPDIFCINTFIKVIQAPKSFSLLKNNHYNFEFYVPRARSIYLIDAANNYFTFKKKEREPIFSYNYLQKSKGKLSIAIEYFNEKDLSVFLVYDVK